jgi:hypothetical protein
MIAEVLQKVSDSKKQSHFSLFDVEHYENILAEVGWKFFNRGTQKIVFQHTDYNFLLKIGFSVLNEANNYQKLPTNIQKLCATVYMSGLIDELEFSLVEKINGREARHCEMEDWIKPEVEKLMEDENIRLNFEWKYHRNIMVTSTNQFRFVDLG